MLGTVSVLETDSRHSCIAFKELTGWWFQHSERTEKLVVPRGASPSRSGEVLKPTIIGSGLRAQGIISFLGLS